jgi:hypothetical protein
LGDPCHPKHMSDLLQCFREIDRADVEPPLRAVPADALVFAWELGSRAFLLFRDREGGPLKGMVFHRNAGSIPAVPTMCQWCHRVRGRGGVTLQSVRVSERRLVGHYLCRDLSCVHADENVSPDDMRESLNADARRKRTLERIRAFAAQRVF